MDELVGISGLLEELAPEFPGLTISKVRFLEAQGLVTPARTPSGYRRYSKADCERVRYILTAQRDHFLPLRVIGEHLDAMARGLTPPEVGDPSPRPPAPEDAVLPLDAGRGVRLTAAELRRNSGLTTAQLREAQEQALLEPGPDGRYGVPQLAAATAIAELAEYGLTTRHLRTVRLAAERQAGLVEQVVGGSQRDAAARAETAVAVAGLASRLAAALLAVRVQADLLDSD